MPDQTEATISLDKYIPTRDSTVFIVGIPFVYEEVSTVLREGVHFSIMGAPTKDGVFIAQFSLDDTPGVEFQYQLHISELGVFDSFLVHKFEDGDVYYDVDFVDTVVKNIIEPEMLKILGKSLL